MVLKARQPFGKDILYDFLGSEKFNWRRLLLLLAAIVVSFIDDLAERNRQKVLITDDSVIERPRSKKVSFYPGSVIMPMANSSRGSGCSLSAGLTW